MKKIPKHLLSKHSRKPSSFYGFLLSRNITPHVTLFLKKIGISSPNFVTILSFILIIVSSLMVVYLKLVDNLFYRVLIAFLIQLSFILDQADGQLARITGKSSKVGAWLDRSLDRLGEFIVFVCFGYAAWSQNDSIRFLLFGIIIGFGFSIFTMAMVTADSTLLNNIQLIEKLTKYKRERKTASPGKKKKFEDSTIILIISKVFFFLDMGTGERYLYMSFFIIINRIDVMLYIMSFLTTLRFISMAYHSAKRLKRLDRLAREYDKENR